jgi:hypothetical protein
MLMKRIISTLLITGVIAFSAAATQAQTGSRKAWPRGGPINHFIPAMSDQVIERAPVAELQIAPQQAMKTALVGSWLLKLEIGNRVVASFTSDGIAIGSSEGDVSLAPDFPTNTPQHGAWKYVGGQQFAVTLAAILYDVPTAESRGLIKIHLLVTLNKAADQFSGTARVEIFDPESNLVDTLSFGLHATRIDVEPFN